MATDCISRIDLGTANELVAHTQAQSSIRASGKCGFDIDQEIKQLEVLKGLDGGVPDDPDLQIDARGIDRMLDMNLGNLKREINACSDKEHEADLWESYYENDYRRGRIRNVLGS